MHHNVCELNLLIIIKKDDLSINQILIKFFTFIDDFAQSKKNMSAYSNIPGFTVGGGSIPHELCITAQKPDIVI